MIERKLGNLFDEDVEALVNSVNCVGVMGRGIALQFKKAFPENFKAYAKACKRREVQPGRMFVYDLGGLSNPRYIINFPTKRHWRSRSRIEDIEAGLAELASEIEERGIRSIAIPPLGTHLGKLNWDDVGPRIEAALGKLDGVKVKLFEPGGGPVDNRPNRSTKSTGITKGRAALVILMDRYLRGLLDPFITLLEVHKLMYFMQEAGENLRLEFEEGHYGPYAANLRHVLKAMENHYTLGYKDGGDAPGKELKLVPGAVNEATAFVDRYPRTRERLDRVFGLIEGFESSFGLELLATAHWVAKGCPWASDKEITDYIHAWNPRKKQFSERQIKLSLKTLRAKEWLEEAPPADEEQPSESGPDAKQLRL